MAVLTHIHKEYFVSFFTDKEVSGVCTGFYVILVSAGVNMAPSGTTSYTLPSSKS